MNTKNALRRKKHLILVCYECHKHFTVCYSNLPGATEATEGMLPAFGCGIWREFTQTGVCAEQAERKGERLRKSKVEITGFVEARLRTVSVVIQGKVFTHSEAVIVN